MMYKNDDRIHIFSGAYRAVSKIDHRTMMQKFNKIDLKSITYDLNSSFPT